MHSNSASLAIRKVRAPRVLAPHGYEQATLAAGALVAGVATFTIGISAFLFAVVISADTTQNFPIMMSLLALAIICLLLWAARMNLGIVRNGVRVNLRGPLQVVPRGYVGLLPTLAGLCFFGAGIIVILSWFGVGGEVITGPLGRYGGGLILLLCGIVLLGYVGIKAFTQAGIQIDVGGVCWWAGITEYALSWDEIISATVQVERRNRSLHITESDGREHKLLPIYFGSDPYYVAEIIQHFLEVPGDRGALAEPLVAIALVAEFEVDGRVELCPGQVN